MINWIRKRLGHHVCEEFTRWTTKQQDVSVTSQYMAVRGIPPVECTKRWQERECTICGKVQQRNLMPPKDA